MSYHYIIVEKRDHVGVIMFNRPDEFNTFNTALATELCGGLMELERDDHIRVVVLKGSGKAFCTGIDISEFHGKTLQEYREWVKLMEQPYHVILYMKKPVIASAHGYAVANGVGIIAVCDLAVVAEGTKFGATAVNVGLFCTGPAVPLSRSLSRKRVLEMVLTGDLYGAEEVEQWGLVNKVVPLERLEEETMALARKLAQKSPIALQTGKQAFYSTADLEFGKALAYSEEFFAALSVTRDAQEGVEAFLKKRKPVWQGR